MRIPSLRPIPATMFLALDTATKRPCWQVGNARRTIAHQAALQHRRRALRRRSAALNPAAHLLPSWLSLTGDGPLVQGVLILLGTFVLEDAATILAAMDVQVGRVGLSVALVALYLGIVLGDLGLYGLGRLAASTPWARRWAPPERYARSREWVCGHVFSLVFISRFLPGARLPTYTACGYFGANVRRFTAAAIVATLIWTTLLFSVSLRLGRLMSDHLGAWRWVGMAGFAVTVILAGRLVARRQTVDAP